MVISSLINMILDPILIYGLDLGMTGAALSTIISIARFRRSCLVVVGKA